MNPDFGEARFYVAMLILSAGIVALFTHFVTGSQYVTLSGTVMTVYAGHSLIDDKFRDRNGPGTG